MRTEDRITNPFLSGSPLERFVHVAATIGWRFRFGDSFFFDAAAGPIVNVERAFYGSEPGDPRSSTTVTASWQNAAYRS